MHRKGLVIGIIILMLGVNIGSSFAGDVDVKTISPVGFDGNTLYVGGSGPNNYTTIQSAINDSADGDTVFVYNDSSPYYERVIVDKSINLVGEDRETTIVNSQDISDAIKVTANSVIVKEFTAVGGTSNWGDSGIKLYRVQNCRIESVYCHSSYFGIFIYKGIQNIILKSNCSIYVEHGICLSESSNNTILNNTLIWNKWYGLCIRDNSNNNSIYNNSFKYNYIGIWTGFNSQHNVFKNNNFLNNDRGIYFYESLYNYIFHNNFIGDNRYSYEQDSTNSWDNGYPSGGNYWDDYNGTDTDGDGIGDTPYPIPGGNNEDRYPLMEPYGMTRLTVSSLSAGLFRTLITIKNIGNKTAFNVQWNFSLDGGIIIHGRYSSGTLPKPLLPGEEMSVSSNMVFGLGRIQITIITWADNAPVISITSPGFLLLFFVFPYIVIPIPIIFPWINIDWHPAQEPYDIGV